MNIKSKQKNRNPTSSKAPPPNQIFQNLPTTSKALHQIYKNPKLKTSNSTLKRGKERRWGRKRCENHWYRLHNHWFGILYQVSDWGFVQWSHNYTKTKLPNQQLCWDTKSVDLLNGVNGFSFFDGSGDLITESWTSSTAVEMRFWD